ncbi:MAG: GNAT family N-acetyltransferase [Archaeoglobus sp.]|nr:GNAT family N-acetyltransferase [Archaeoglobus sp.]
MPDLKATKAIESAIESIKTKQLEVKDKKGEVYTIRFYVHSKDREKLIEMYETFSPELRCLGLPPTTRTGIEHWIDYLAENGIAFVAERDGRIIGHAVLVPTEDGKEVDVTIFVHQDFQNRGIGQQLMKVAIEFSRQKGYKGMMLVTERTNQRAIHVYKKLGFKVVDPYFEYDMYLDLRKNN